MRMTYDFTYKQGEFRRTSNPLYNSGSSLDEKPNYDEVQVERGVINNATYTAVIPDQNNGRTLVNDIYGFPDTPCDPKINSAALTSGKDSLRPSSAYRDMKKNKPIPKLVISDGSIERQKQSIISELQRNLQERNV